MSSMIDEADRELVWDIWLAGLSPWEIHWLTPRELDLHDEFVAGLITIPDVERMISAAFTPA